MKRNENLLPDFTNAMFNFANVLSNKKEMERRNEQERLKNENLKALSQKYRDYQSKNPMVQAGVIPQEQVEYNAIGIASGEISPHTRGNIEADNNVLDAVKMLQNKMILDPDPESRKSALEILKRIQKESIAWEAMSVPKKTSLDVQKNEKQKTGMSSSAGQVTTNIQKQPKKSSLATKNIIVSSDFNDVGKQIIDYFKTKPYFTMNQTFEKNTQDVLRATPKSMEELNKSLIGEKDEDRAEMLKNIYDIKVNIQNGYKKNLGSFWDSLPQESKDRLTFETFYRLKNSGGKTSFVNNSTGKVESLKIPLQYDTESVRVSGSGINLPENEKKLISMLRSDSRYNKDKTFMQKYKSVIDKINSNYGSSISY